MCVGFITDEYSGRCIVYITDTQSYIKRQKSGRSSDDDWQPVVQRVITHDNEWERMTTSGTTSGTASVNKWQPMTKSRHFG